MTSSSPYKHPSTTTPPPTTSPLSANLDFISHTKHHLYTTLSTSCPWHQLFNYYLLACPKTLSEALTRLKTNLSYFRMNFTMIILLFLFLSLLWHPISLIVFLAMMLAWLFLYFLRDEPLVAFGSAVDDRDVLTILSVFTVGFLLLTHATVNIVVSLAVGVVFVAVYSIFRRSDDFFWMKKKLLLVVYLPVGPLLIFIQLLSVFDA